VLINVQSREDKREGHVLSERAEDVDFATCGGGDGKADVASTHTNEHDFASG
jgi:hypothetical protein